MFTNDNQHMTICNTAKMIGNSGCSVKMTFYFYYLPTRWMPAVLTPAQSRTFFITLQKLICINLASDKNTVKNE